MTKHSDTVWQTPALSRTYLEGIRAAIPLAEEQIDVTLRLVRATVGDVAAFLDLGCGDGILGHALYEAFSPSQGVFVDFSPPMLAAARKRLQAYSSAQFFELDYGQVEWTEQVAPYRPFDVVVSGFSIHHQPDKRKKAIYQEVYELLRPGGLFINIEHVASPTEWLAGVFDTYFIDSLYDYHKANGSGMTRDEVAQQYVDRPDKASNNLTLVEEQCRWLRQIGFTEVDCYLKIFELAVFGGVK